MAKYSEFIVFFWLVPVLLQILLPLMMLVVYSTVRLLQALFFRRVPVKTEVAEKLGDQKLQPSTT